MSIAQLQQIKFVRPRSVEEACAEIASAVAQKKKTWAIAGCTDWMVARHMDAPSDVHDEMLAVDISRLDDLLRISFDDDVLFLGASVTFSMLRQNMLVKKHAHLLTQMAATVGAEQIQQRGTLGGNLISGSPAADGVTALFSLDAMVTLRSVQGERQVPVRSFYTGYRQSVRRPDELVVGFSIAKMNEPSAYLWRKVGTRKAQSIAKAAVAAVLAREDGKLVRVGFGVGSVAERVVDLGGLRKLLLGKTWAEVDMQQCETAIENGIRPIDDLRSTAAYRRHVVRQTLMRFLREQAMDTASV